MAHPKLQVYEQYWAAYFYKKHPTTISGYIKGFITRAGEMYAYYKDLFATISLLYITPQDHQILIGELEDTRNEIGDIVSILYLLFDEQELEITKHHKRRLEKMIDKLEAAKRVCTDFKKRIEKDEMLVVEGDRRCSFYDEIPYTINFSVIREEFKKGYREN